MLAEINARKVLEQVLQTFESIGYPRDVVQQWSIPAPDAEDLSADLAVALQHAIAREPRARVLEIGTFVGTSALFMLLAHPDIEVHTVDPNFPLEIEFDAMHCNFRAADLAVRTQDIAARAAEKLGIRARLHLHAGGFATAATFAGADAPVGAIGSDVIARHGPFDAVFVDGLHFEDAVLADLRLAATAVRDGAPILMHDAIGYWGSCVRRAVGRFLEESPHFSFAHAPYGDLYRSIARLTTRPTICTDSPVARAERNFGAHFPRYAEYAARVLHATFGALDASAHDALSEALSGALSDAPAQRLRDHASVSCVIALGTLDELAPPASNIELRAITSQADVVVLGFTPPGEAHAAGTWSRPLASRIAELDAIGFDAFDLIVPFLEPFSYPLGSNCVLAETTSFLSTTLVAVRRGSASSARVAHLDPVRPADARRLDDVRTQRIHNGAMIARLRADQAAGVAERDRSNATISELRAIIESQRVEIESQRVELDARQRALDLTTRSLATAESHLANVTGRLQHMLDWRVHIGRHHFWRRLDARI